MAQIWGLSTWEVSKRCLSCKHRLERLTGGCRVELLSSFVGPQMLTDDLFGCNNYQPIKEKKDEM